MGDFSESVWLEAENQRLKSLVERMNNADRRQVRREAFLRGFEAGKKGNAFRHATEVGREITQNRMAELEGKVKYLRGQLAASRATALKAVRGELAAEKQLEDLKAKHKEELRAAKHAAWNVACHEIRAAALVVGSKDHKYVSDAMGEFE